MHYLADRKVDQIADETKDNPTVVKAVTLEVDTKDAQKLTLAAGAGQLSLALRQAASGEGEATQRITLSDLSGETPADVAKRQAEEKRLSELEEGIRSLGASFDDKLNKLSQSKVDTEVKEVVKEVVKYVEPERPAHATVGVFRGTEREVYDVPRAE